MSIILSGINLSGMVSLGVPTSISDDPYFYAVSLLLSTTSTNNAQNLTFIDNSINNMTVSAVGSPVQGSFTPYEPTGYWSGYYTTGMYDTMPVNTALQLGSSNFTIEFWFNADAFSATQGLIGNTVNAGGGNSQWVVQLDTSGILRFTGWTGVYLTSSTAVTPGTWNHVAIVKDGANSLSMFLNGTRVANNTSDSTNFSSTNAIVVGREASGSAQFNGYISNIRLVKGSAVYSASATSITVPTSALTAITNTVLLINQSNISIDNSINAFTITRSGGAFTSHFSPFAPTTAYSTSSNGGSVYVSSSNYLTVTNPSTNFNWGTGDFTIEGWIYPTVTMPSGTIIFGSHNVGSASGWYLSVSNTAISWDRFGYGSNLSLSVSKTISLNSWYHIALVRNSGTLTIYVNGVSLGTQNDSANNYSSIPYNPSIGADQNGDAGIYTGYISNLRTVKGTAVYTSNFSVPTAPVTSIANTSFLLNGTNSGLYDSAAINDLYSFDGAKVSTAQFKWSPTSAYFDGTNDYLKAATSNRMVDVNSGDFTIECWVNFSNIGSDRALISKYGTVGEGSGGYGWLVQWATSNNLRLVLGNNGTDSVYSFAWTPSINTWYHVAITRNGTNGRAFINGTQIGSTQTVITTNSPSLNSLQIGKTHTVNQYMNGYLQDIRFTKGIARYTSNFTVPSAAFPLQ